MVVPDFRGAAAFYALAHKCYGSWDMFRQLQWAEVWRRHCEETGHFGLIKVVYDLPIYRRVLEGGTR